MGIYLGGPVSGWESASGNWELACQGNGRELSWEAQLLGGNKLLGIEKINKCVGIFVQILKTGRPS